MIIRCEATKKLKKLMWESKIYFSTFSSLHPRMPSMKNWNKEQSKNWYRLFATGRKSLVFGHFGNEVTKILCNLCLHFARQDGKNKKKNGKKITQIMLPKYQKPKDKNMVWMKHRRCFPTKILQPFAFDVKKISSDQMSSELFKNSYQKGADGRWNIECSWKKCEFKKSLAPLRTIKIMDCIVTYNKGLFIVQTSDPKHRPCALVIYIKIFRKL